MMKLFSSLKFGFVLVVISYCSVIVSAQESSISFNGSVKPTALEADVLNDVLISSHSVDLFGSSNLFESTELFQFDATGPTWNTQLTTDQDGILEIWDIVAINSRNPSDLSYVAVGYIVNNSVATIFITGFDFNGNELWNKQYQVNGFPIKYAFISNLILVEDGQSMPDLMFVINLKQTYASFGDEVLLARFNLGNSLNNVTSYFGNNAFFRLNSPLNVSFTANYIEYYEYDYQGQIVSGYLISGRGQNGSTQGHFFGLLNAYDYSLYDGRLFVSGVNDLVRPKGAFFTISGGPEINLIGEIKQSSGLGTFAAPVLYTATFGLVSGVLSSSLSLQNLPLDRGSISITSEDIDRIGNEIGLMVTGEFNGLEDNLITQFQLPFDHLAGDDQLFDVGSASCDEGHIAVTNFYQFKSWQIFLKNILEPKLLKNWTRNYLLPPPTLTMV